MYLGNQQMGMLIFKKKEERRGGDKRGEGRGGEGRGGKETKT